MNNIFEIGDRVRIKRTAPVIYMMQGYVHSVEDVKNLKGYVSKLTGNFSYYVVWDFGNEKGNFINDLPSNFLEIDVSALTDLNMVFLNLV